MVLLQVAQLFVPEYCRKFLKCDFRVVQNDINFVPNFIQINPTVLEVNHVDGETDMTDLLIIYNRYMRFETTSVNRSKGTIVFAF
jgi:hypothetical protein